MSRWKQMSLKYSGRQQRALGSRERGLYLNDAGIDRAWEGGKLCILEEKLEGFNLSKSDDYETVDEGLEEVEGEVEDSL